jgi:hypothetical protein
VWNLQIGPCQRPTGDWRIELQAAAYQTHTLAGRGSEVLLYVDGSYASQVMVESFYWGQIPFRCLIPRFEKDLNLHALSQAVLMLEERGISYEICNVELGDFLAGEEIKTWAKKYSTDRVDQLVAMHVWKQHQHNSKFVVFPFGLLGISHILDTWKVVECERDYGIYQFQKDQRLTGVPCFFKWNPEVITSFLKDPQVRSIVTNQKSVPGLTDSVLKEILQNYFKILGARNCNGFEKSEFLVKRFHRELEKSGFFKTAAFSIGYADFLVRLQFKNTPVTEGTPDTLKKNVVGK